MYNKPLVSIIVPCYNQAPYLPEALESILNQSYTNWECLIVNDGSPDNTSEIVKEWLEKDSRFKYIEKENSGVCDTRNKGITQAQGEYILPLDADDKIAKPYIECAIDAFTQDPNLKLVYCNTVLFGVVNRKAIPIPYSFERMLSENLIHHAAIFRKSDFQKTIGYNLNMHDGLEDWDFWITLLNPEDKVKKLDGFYYYYRIKNISRSTQINFERNERLILQMFKNHEEKYLQYFNPVRDHINHLHYKAEYDKLLKSTPYKVGKFIYSPVSLFKRLLRKLS